MRNRYQGTCELCKKLVPPKQGIWRLIPKYARDFTGLRCKECSLTTNAGRKATEKKFNKLNT